MRKKCGSQIHKCPKQNCCGAENQHENYLSATDRIHGRNQSKKKVKKSKKKDSAIKDILKQTYQHLKQQNQQLYKKLALRKQKIDELKNVIKEYQQQMKRYQQLQREWAESNDQKQERHKKLIKQEKQQKKYAQIIQGSHDVAKETLQRYRKLEDEFNRYRENAEKKMEKLRSQKQKLASESTQKIYNKQIQELKQELTKFKEDQVTGASLKSLHYHQQSPPSSHEEKLKTELSRMKVSISTLKSQNNELKSYIKQLEEELEERTTNSQNKERELKNNLDVINDKINKWQKDYHLLKEESANWQKEYNNLLEKYQRKKQKHKMNNAQWAEIFKQFIHQIDKLKQQLDNVSERNVKLIKMYGHT